MATDPIAPIPAPENPHVRLDVHLHQLLQAPGTTRPRLQPVEPLGLPAPVFPLRGFIGRP